MVFFVYEGKVLVEIGTQGGEVSVNEFAITKGGVWVVPRGEFSVFLRVFLLSRDGSLRAGWTWTWSTDCSRRPRLERAVAHRLCGPALSGLWTHTNPRHQAAGSGSGVCDALSSQAFRHAIEGHSKAVLTADSRPAAASRRGWTRNLVRATLQPETFS